MSERVGVYVCGCGDNIAGTVDIESVAGRAAGIGGVAAAKTHNLLCSEDGKAFLENEIREGNLDSIVVAACSPRDHEQTFRRVCEKAELNPFMLQMTNIREHCSWVTAGRDAATEKAARLVAAAVNRVKLHAPLAPPDVECSPDVVVIGAGVAGMETALLLARKGRKVTLVEKSPCIGGMTTRYEEVFPSMECATCMLEPRMDEILHNENIELLTLSEVEEVVGFLGGFTVKIRKKARYVEEAACFGCGVCLEPCPVEVANEYNEGLDRRKAVYVPYPGALPNVPAVDASHCLKLKGQECNACAEACGFAAFNFEQKDEVIERGAGAIVAATGFALSSLSNLSEFGFGKHENVVTSLELERLISTTGPTGGKIVLKNGKPPKRVAIVHCAGRCGGAASEYCSGVCCMNNLKLARALKSKVEGVDVTLFYSNLCLPGGGARDFLDSAVERGVEMKRVADFKEFGVASGKGTLSIRFVGADGKKGADTADMVVLTPAIVPGTDTKKIADVLSVELDKRGFFARAHGSIDPVATRIAGVYTAGCAQGPADIRESVVRGKAAAGEILSRLVPGEKLELEAITAFINGEVCSGCRMCNSLCPFKAISFDEEKKISVVNEVLCKGCGTCAAACPGGAAASRHFDKNQIEAELAGLMA